MRCLNCGWDNPDHTNVCVKCGQPLINTEAAGQTNSLYTPQPTLKATIEPSQDICRETVRIQPGGIHAATQRLHNPQICKRCGYPVVTGAANCPNCGSPMQLETPKKEDIQSEQPSTEIDLGTCVCDTCGIEVDSKFSFCPKCGSPIRRKTIRRPIKQIAELKKDLGPSFTLTIIPESHENIEAVTLSYQGDSVVLNRSNTEQNNYTITSKEQAKLTFENGKWFIVDNSEQQTTYIQVTRKMELSGGDIIILGDRKFRFNNKE